MGDETMTRQDSQLDFGTIPDELKKDLVPRTPTRTIPDAKFYEVEGAVFRKRPAVPMEIFHQKKGTWGRYSGDPSRVYRMSNDMSLDEVRPYMDVEPLEDA